LTRYDALPCLGGAMRRREFIAIPPSLLAIADAVIE
jgi:hypothetical protein